MKHSYDDLGLANKAQSDYMKHSYDDLGLTNKADSDMWGVGLQEGVPRCPAKGHGPGVAALDTLGHLQQKS